MPKISPAESYLHPAGILPYLELAPGMLVGDFGVGGAAHFALPVAKLVGDQGGVVMFDILKPALSAALSQAKLRGLQNCKAVWSNLEIYGGAKGVAENSLNAGLLVNVLSQSDKYKDILAEVHRMLKTGAKLLIVDWQSESTLKIAPDKKKRLPAGHVEQTAKGLGFSALKRFAADPNHWGLVLVKT